MTTVTPGTIGGRFTNALPWTGQPVISVQDGGRRRKGGLVGSGSSASPGSQADDGSSSGLTGTWADIAHTQGTKENTWSSYLPTNASPYVWFKQDYATGSLDPHPGANSYYSGSTAFNSEPDWAPNSTFPGFFAYQDNPFGGATAGPDGSAVRDPGSWIVTSTQPPSQTDPATGQYRVTDTGSIKTAIASEYNFTPLSAGVPISSFKEIRGYRSKLNPAGASLNYDSSWDIYGWAHTAPTQWAISLEVMFWTYWSGGQAPWNISASPVPQESGLDFGDGNIWDLYMTPSTAQDGGVSANYSYGIFCLHGANGSQVTSINGPAPAVDQGWVDILSPLKYFVKHYVVTSGGAAANPLDIPIWQIIEGWEIASTNHAPVQFTHLDARLEMS